MKIWTLFALTGLLAWSCSTNSTDDKAKGLDEIKFTYQDTSKSFDIRFKDYLKNAIGIEEGENYGVKTYEEHLNDDKEKEIIITVNRKEFALKQAQKNNSVSRASSVDYFGNYNYIVIYNSKTKQFSNPIIMGSSAYKPLELHFENIGPYQHKDMIVDYTIGDAKFRKYFLFSNKNDKINYAFHWIVFQDWNKGNTDAVCFSYEKGLRSDFKDIVVKKAKIAPLKEGENYNLIDAKIECEETVIKRFFFNPEDGKYYTADL